jgi:multiple sugar transport system ATP-binding protein
MAEVVIEHLTKVYDNGFQAVTDLNLHIKDAEFLVLVGPSGCGKSTALRMIAGLEQISRGTLRIGDRVVNDVAPKDRDIAMVFQNYALYPHMTVYDNIAFALKLRKVPKDEIDRRVKEAARILELTEWLPRKPGQLSGGQRQRVAMGRAIVREPSAFLMDEPLSNLDAKLRVQMRAEIARIQKDLGVTTFYVTHDQIEAMTMGDRVAVIKRGVLQQVDAPQRLYDRPDNLFVAAFIGSPSMNLFEADLVIEGDQARVRLGSQELSVDPSVLGERPALRAYGGRPVIVGIRPEDMHDASLARDHPPDRRLRATVDITEALGSEIIAHFTIDARPVLSEETRELAAELGQDALAGLERSASEQRSAVVSRFDPRSTVRGHDPVEVAVDTDRMHFFDPETRLAIWE